MPVERRSQGLFRGNGLLRLWGVAMLAAVLGTGACSVIIGNELSGKPASSGSGGSTGSGGAHMDGGPGGRGPGGGGPGGGPHRDAGTGGRPHGCSGDGDCATMPGHPVCEVDAGTCVACTPSDDACPSGQHCTPANECAPGCVQASDCPPLQNATAACSGGVCILGACLPGFGDCDGITQNGCEVDLGKSPLDCGTCGNACSLLHASATCKSGACAIGSCEAGYANCDGVVENGCEVDTQGDVDNCGTCGKICMLPMATSACVGGACAIAACAPGFLDCDFVAADGCEVDRSTDMQNCGTCGNACALAHASATCAAGVCAIDTCDPGFADCNGDAQSGCETNLQTSVANCGACGNACSTNNATPSCSLGACKLACQTGFADCDGDVTNGCETSTLSDVANCGGCGKVCPAGGGTPYCKSGACGVASCAAGHGACGGGTTCSTDLTSDPANCGACGHACTVANGTGACVNGVCAVGSCNTGFADCDGQYADGCEVNLASSTSCGACGVACLLPNAQTSCATGTCAIVSCTGTYADCDGIATNGCETNLATSVTSCGACSHACSSANAAPTCSNGVCSPSCNPGFGDCDGDPSNGCETNLGTDSSHCGSCSTVCSLPNAVGACSGGTCAVASCVAPYADCDGVASNGCEANTQSSIANCGACGNTCNANGGVATCTGSTCGITCNPGYGNCDGMIANGCEANLQADVNNCGACGHVCPSSGGTPSCVAGACGFASCSAGVGNCSGTGCTTNLTNDPMNCGACGNECTVANGTGACMNSTCVIASCNAGFSDCDGQYANGCEANLKTNANCGACGVACALPNATTSCATGACALVACTGTYANCDGVAQNGCEVDLSSSVASCGACGNACSTVNATPSCVSGACTLACAAGFGDCDMNVATGCEANVATDVFNCGGCGRACSAMNVASLDCRAGVCDSTCAPGFGNCSEPTAPAADDGCETNVGASAASCGSCNNACALQGPSTQPLVCSPTQSTTDRCGCSSDAECNLGSAAGTCKKGTGTCVCGSSQCKAGEVCVHQTTTDACSCNGGAACGAGQTCCQTPAGCVDLTVSATSCGACGHACPMGFSCQVSQCRCSSSMQCNAGTAGTCTANGMCQCGTTLCAAGQRCLPNGSCG